MFIASDALRHLFQKEKTQTLDDMRDKYQGTQTLSSLLKEETKRVFIQMHDLLTYDRWYRCAVFFPFGWV